MARSFTSEYAHLRESAMKITNANLFRLAGLSALIGGLCYVLVGIFHPANAPASVTTTRWGVVHVIACAMSFFGVLGLTGIYARQAVKAGWLGLAGYVLLSLWMVLIMGFSFVEAFILPQMATATPAFVDGWMKMFNGGTSTIDLGVLPTLWTLTGAALHPRRPAVRHRDLPRPHPAARGRRAARPRDRAGARGRQLSLSAQPKIAIPTGLALAWLGYALMTERRTPADAARSDASSRSSRMSIAATAPSHRRISLAAGIAYVLTFVSIPTLALYDSVKGANYVLGSGPDTAAIVGGLLEIIVALAGIATAVILFPMLKKQNETFALGLVAARILESATIFVGVAFLLSIVTLRQDGAGAGALATSHALVALYDRIFLLGQSFMPAVCDLLLGLHALQVAPGASTPVRDRHRRRPAPRRRLPRRAVRRHRPARRLGRTVRAPGRRLRVLARRLAHRQRIQPGGGCQA